MVHGAEYVPDILQSQNTTFKQKLPLSIILIRVRRFLKNLQVIMTTILKSFRALSTIVMLQGLFLCILETGQICDLYLRSTNKLQCSSPLLRFPLPNVDSSLIHWQINANLNIGKGEKKYTLGKVRKIDWDGVTWESSVSFYIVFECNLTSINLW